MSYHVEKRARMEEGSASEVQRECLPPEKIVFNVTTQEFRKAVEFNAFVDKTLFIKAFLEAEEDAIVVLAPRRFGKSVNMDMVKEFVTGNKKLFEDNHLKIWKEERAFFDKYCQENSVIYVDFKGVGGITPAELLRTLKDLICCAFYEHRYLAKEIDGKYSWSDPKLEVVGPIEECEKYWKNSENLDEDDAIDGLRFLSECLYVYHDKPVYVFIDEYDFPITKMILREGSENDEVLDETIEVIGSLMSSLFKNNKYIKKGLINACLRIAQVFSGYANNIRYYEFLRKPTFSPYFGFTDAEVNSLFKKEEFVPFKSDQVKEWYNGYRLMHTKDYVIYSCFSILNYLKKSKKMNKPEFEKYWIDSGSVAYLEPLFGKPLIHKLVEDLIGGEEIEIKSISKYAKQDIIALKKLIHQDIQNVDTLQAHRFLQFLTENGYLNVVSRRDETITIRIPNLEIEKELREKCYNVEALKIRYKLCPENISIYLTALESALKEKDKRSFTNFAKAVSKLFDGAVIPEGENEFHSILFAHAYNIKTLTAGSEVSVRRKKTRGRPPRLDMLAMLNKTGMILEFKFEHQTSREAYIQIKTQQYETFFDDYNKHIAEKILVGVHMTRERKVTLTYAINGLPEETVTSNDNS